MNWAPRIRVWSVVAVPVIGMAGLAAIVCGSRASAELCDRVMLVAVVVSILAVAVASWSSAWFARRVTALASAARQMSEPLGATPTPNEPDAQPGSMLPRDVERPLEGLATELKRASSAVQSERHNTASRLTRLEQRNAEHSQLLTDFAGVLGDAIGEVQLPLHILLENRFGDLSDNQEEMLQAAAAGADRIDHAVRQIRRVLDLENGRTVFKREAVKPAELIGPPVAMAASRAERKGVEVRSTVAPVLASVIGDRYLLEEALAGLLVAVADHCRPASTMTVDVSEGRGFVGIDVTFDGDAPRGMDILLATRLIRSQSGTTEIADGRVTIKLAAERKAAVGAHRG
jgi:signal transduction histidine kinase